MKDDEPSSLGAGMIASQMALISQAETILNRTLAYQAATAVHELKERLGLDVTELRLVVVPESVAMPGCYRVICTIGNFASSE